MFKKWIPRPLSLVISALVLVAVLSNSLTGCTAGTGTPLARVFGNLSEIAARDAAMRSPDFQRFQQVYDKYATESQDRDRQLRHFTDAYTRVRDEFVQSLTDQQLIDSAISGIEDLKKAPASVPPADLTESALDRMLVSLDPHSSYLNPEEFREMQVSTRGEFGGLGIEISLHESGSLRVIAPIEDTPAFRAGLKSGDLITHVENDPIKGMSLMEAVRRLRGKPRTDVRLTVSRTGVTPFRVTITRDVIRVVPVKWRVEGDVGVLRITHFIQSSNDALEQAIRQIRAQAGPSLKGLVLDLRNNPGGLLLQSVAVTDTFLRKSRQVVSVRDREGEVRGYESRTPDFTRNLPLVVLINGGSASASEIVAGALQDHRRATVIGTRSFGKGSVQTIIPLEVAGALRLTTQLYYLPSGRSIQGGGVDPDIVISTEGSADDRHEGDNPKALKTPQPPRNQAQVQLQDETCPTAGTENKDRLLGCALMFVRAGSQARFMALINSRKAL